MFRYSHPPPIAVATAVATAASPISATHSGGLEHRRRDLDGLRAIAILSVLGYHAFGGAVPGGYVGVDVFFVISGFLISSIIFVALKQGSFSFIDFYSRRARRIFPALIVVLIAVMLIGSYSLLPDEFAQLGKHVAAGAAFVANVVLYRESGYFDHAAELKPLLHLWSLGVEEQFYLFWPLVLVLAWRVRRVSVLIIALGLVSFALNVLRIRGHEMSTFYLPFSRLWELLAGGLLAYRGQRHGPLVSGKEKRLDPNVASLVGLALIVIAVFGLQRTMLYPGWWALLPIVGTCALIWAGEAAWVNRALLGARPMVFIGLISYPLYLWHWPLLSFERIVDPDHMTSAVRFALLAAAFVLAWLTYRLAEIPIRINRRKGFAAIAMTMLIAVIGVFGFLSARGDLRPRSAQFGLDKLVAAAAARAYPGPNLHPVGHGWSALMRQGTNRSTVLFIGDSFIEQYYPRIDQVLQEDPQGTRSVIYASSGGCLPIPGVTEIHHALCATLIQQATEYATQPEVKAVVIGANWLGYFLPQNRDPRYDYRIAMDSGGAQRIDEPMASARALSQLSTMISKLRKAGKSVYLILPSANELRFDPRRMIERSWGNMSFSINAPIIARSTLIGSMEPIRSELKATSVASGSNLLDPMDTLCAKMCSALLEDGVPIYMDGDHLNPEYVRREVRFLDPVLRLSGVLAASD
jgi:peptidoglycan/LPS O-acetylase OafA/YrhL